MSVGKGKRPIELRFDDELARGVDIPKGAARLSSQRQQSLRKVSVRPEDLGVQGRWNRVFAFAVDIADFWHIFLLASYDSSDAA